MASRNKKTETGLRPVAAEISIVADEPPENVFDRMREVYAIAKAAHAEIYSALKVAEQNIAKVPIAEMVDCMLAIRSAAELCDDIRKECNRTKAILEKMACIQWSTNAVNEGEIIRGICATGSPQEKTRVILPSFDKDPEAYNQLMDWLNIDVNLRDQGKILYVEGEFDTEVVKINWPGFHDYLNALLIQGYPLPPGIDQRTSYIDYVMRITKTHDLL
jgi:hypothetical protein